MFTAFSLSNTKADLLVPVKSINVLSSFFLQCLSLKGIVCGDGMVQCDEEGLLDECMVCSDQKRLGLLTQL